MTIMSRTLSKVPVPILRGVALILILGGALSSCAAPLQQQATHGVREVEKTRYATNEPSQESVAAAPLPDSADLYTLLRYAAENNPGLEANFERWKAAAERIPQVKALADPRLTYGHFFQEVETRVGPQTDRVGLTQMFPWFGTLRLKGDIAASNALIAEQHFQAVEDRLYVEVINAYAEYYYLHRSIAITTELVELVTNAEAVAQAKYRAGVGPYADVIRAQVELGKLEDQLAALNDRLRPVRARVNAALNRPLDAPLAAPDSLPSETLALTDDALIAQVQVNNPNLQALGLAIDREDQAIALAKRKYYPSFTLGVDYINTGDARMPGVTDSGKDPVMGMFSINIPLWHGSYGAGVREARARRRAAELDQRDQENQILAKMRSVLFAFHDAERKSTLYRDALIPKARQSVQASATGYESGQTDFISFLDAERVLLEFQLAYDRSRADHLQRLAELRALVGGAYGRTTDN